MWIEVRYYLSTQESDAPVEERWTTRRDKEHYECQP